MSLFYYGSKDRKLLEEIEEQLDELVAQAKTETAIQKEIQLEQREIADALNVMATDQLPSIAEALGQSLELQTKILAAILALQTPGGGTKPAVALKFSFGTAGNK